MTAVYITFNIIFYNYILNIYIYIKNIQLSNIRQKKNKNNLYGFNK